MTTQEIANRLVALCRTGQFDQAQEELYSQDAVSIEPRESPDFAKETKGLDAIREKSKKWESMVQEMKEIEVSEPMIAGNAFALTMRMNVVMKERGAFDMTELCVYETKDGKITSERFFM